MFVPLNTGEHAKKKCIYATGEKPSAQAFYMLLITERFRSDQSLSVEDVT